MVDEKKRLTPAELRAQQEARVRLDAETRKKAMEKAATEREAKNQAEQYVAADRIKTTWYNDVVAVSQSHPPEIRFLVLAMVAPDYAAGKRVVDDICASIASDGYSCEIALLRDEILGPTTRSIDEIEGKVLLINKDGSRDLGWKPARVPEFRPSAGSWSHRWLIVKW